ncbi:MAG: DNA cytosine methyltransferase [Flavobacteriaceae bacterium]
MSKDKIEVIELFAGVGGFKLGLEGDSKGKSSTSNYKNNLNSNYKVIWSNQFEPLTKTVQHASEIYKSVWPDDNHSNKDIEKVIENDFKSIPDHDMLVGGFPCQDYSVATTLKNSKV